MAVNNKKVKTKKSTSSSPSWINQDGELVSEALKSLVSKHAKRLSHGSVDVQCGEVEAFLSLINLVWTLETHVAKEAADLIAHEIKYVTMQVVHAKFARNY